MIRFILKDKFTGIVNKVTLYENNLFKNSEQFSNVGDKETVKNFSYRCTESESLVLVLDSSDFSIIYKNHSVRNILNLKYKLIDGSSIFDLFPSLSSVGMEEIFNNMEIGESKKFDYNIYQDDKLISCYVLEVFKSSDSILFTSSQNINYDVPLDKPKGLLFIIQDDSVVYANDEFLNFCPKIKKEIYTFTMDDFSKNYGNEFIEAYENIKNGYSISKEFTLMKKISDVEHKFRIFLSTIVYKNKPSIRVNILDITNSNIINELIFKSQNDIQTLRSFAKIATFNQDSDSNGISWSSEASSVLGMVPSSISLNDDLFAYIVPEEKVSFEKSWINAIINKQDIVTNFTIKSPSGELKYLSLFAKIFYSEKGEIINIQGIIQDISQLSNYKSKFEEALFERDSYLKRDHEILQVIFDYIYKLSMEEDKQYDNPGDALEKTQNRLFAISLAHKLAFSSSKFNSLNLDNFFKKFFEGLINCHGFSLNLNLNVENITADFNQVLTLAFSINEVISVLFKFASPQMSASIDVFIDKNDSNLDFSLLIDLVLISESEFNNELSDFKKLIKKCNCNKFQISINDLGTQFDLSFS